MLKDQKKFEQYVLRTLGTGGIPIGFHPDEPFSLIRGAMSEARRGAFFLPETFSESGQTVIERVCVRAQTEQWAWDEMRGLLDLMIFRDDPIPPPLRQFLAVRRPPKYGRNTTIARDIRLHDIATTLEEIGFNTSVVVSAFQIPPRPGADDHRDSTLRHIRRRARRKLAKSCPVPGRQPQRRNLPVLRITKPVSPTEEQDNDDPSTILHALLLKPKCPGVVFLWNEEFDHRPKLIDRWCSLATTEAWAWDECRELVDAMVYQDQPIPDPLRELTISRRPHAAKSRTMWRNVRWAYGVFLFQASDHSEEVARRLCVRAVLTLNAELDESTVRKGIYAAREKTGDYFSSILSIYRG